MRKLCNKSIFFHILVSLFFQIQKWTSFQEVIVNGRKSYNLIKNPVNFLLTRAVMKKKWFGLQYWFWKKNDLVCICLAVQWKDGITGIPVLVTRSLNFSLNKSVPLPNSSPLGRDVYVFLSSSLMEGEMDDLREEIERGVVKGRNLWGDYRDERVKYIRGGSNDMSVRVCIHINLNCQSTSSWGWRLRSGKGESFVKLDFCPSSTRAGNPNTSTHPHTLY